MESISAVKGFADLFPQESYLFSIMEDTARKIFNAYGYGELRTPIVEYTQLFQRGIGDETDVVQKEMFTFADRKDRPLTLRPEATAGVVRACIQSGILHTEQELKLFTTGPMFRYERPQKGRMRQFHQLNCECLGPVLPHTDAEIILMLYKFLQALGVDALSIQINSLGCKQCRPQYNELLHNFLQTLDASQLCTDCQRRQSTNPLRVLDCKVPSCQKLLVSAPNIGDHLCAECNTHFQAVLTLLNAAKLPYTLTPRLVRGLDYYTRTTFEVVSDAIGAQGSVAGGGRYDGLVQQLGGPDIAGIGFACGMERLALLLQQKKDPPSLPAPDFYIAVLDKQGFEKGFFLAQQLRQAGLVGECSLTLRQMKQHMRRANQKKAYYCCILGSNELETNTVTIKNMHSGVQESITLDAAATYCAQK